MSIASEITRIKNNIASAYNEIESKGGTIPQTPNSSNLATAVESISSSSGNSGKLIKDVNFFDYEGTIIESYSKNEFLQLQKLPDGPSHSGLIFDGWNWSLNDAKEQVSIQGAADIYRIEGISLSMVLCMAELFLASE